MALDLALFNAAELPEETFSHLPLDILLTVLTYIAVIDPWFNKFHKVSRRCFYLSVEALKTRLIANGGIYALTETRVWALPYVLDCVRLVTCDDEDFGRFGIPLGVTYLHIDCLDLDDDLPRRRVPYHGVKTLVLTDPEFIVEGTYDMIHIFADLLALYIVFVHHTFIYGAHMMPLTSPYVCLVMLPTTEFFWPTFSYALKNVEWFEMRSSREPRAPYNSNTIYCLGALESCRIIKYYSVKLNLTQPVEKQSLTQDMRRFITQRIPHTLRILAFSITGVYADGEAFSIDYSRVIREPGNIVTHVSYDEAYTMIELEMDRRVFYGQVPDHRFAVENGVV